MINATVGGSFGGKDDITLQILAALGAQATGVPVRLVNTREESILSHSKRHAARMRYELGAMRDGRLVALRAQIYCDTGAYASFGPAVGGLMTELAAGPYRVPNVAIDTYIVYTNNPVGGAMRGFGAPQVNFAIESCMDMLAEQLDRDSIDLRLQKRLAKGGAARHRRDALWRSAAVQLSPEGAESPRAAAAEREQSRGEGLWSGHSHQPIEDWLWLWGTRSVHHAYRMASSTWSGDPS